MRIIFLRRDDRILPRLLPYHVSTSHEQENEKRYQADKKKIAKEVSHFKIVIADGGFATFRNPQRSSGDAGMSMH